MKKTSFIPNADRLEGRVVLSSGPSFINGAAVLTTRALNQTYAQVQKAFNQYAAHGQNLTKLEVNLANAVNRIPWNRRDGLLSNVEAEAVQMQSDIANGVPTPVKAAAQRAIQDVSDFVNGEIANGVIVMNGRVGGGPLIVSNPSSGAAVLTTRALNQTYNQIQKAFNQFATRGQNFSKLQVNLASAVNRIPWNKRDGLLSNVEAEAVQMQSDIANGVPTPVKAASQRALQDVHDFVNGEIANGVIVLH